MKARSKMSAAIHLLLIATANVNTLLQPGRIDILDREFDRNMMDIIGIQEGREPEEGIRESEHYKRYVAAGVSGNYGVQLWIHQSLKLTVREVDVVNTRLMTVVTKLHSSSTLLVFIVGHAPHMGEDELVRKQFCKHPKAINFTRLQPSVLQENLSIAMAIR